jgi:hypothetical protein
MIGLVFRETNHSILSIARQGKQCAHTLRLVNANRLCDEGSVVLSHICAYNFVNTEAFTDIYFESLVGERMPTI